MGCKRDALNPLVSELSKHVDMKTPFIVNNVKNQYLIIHHVATQKIATDGISKNPKRRKCMELIKLPNTN